ncbi:MAG: hypothetical protein IAG10_27655 [Planctomycetaceae bacterium]|nr:hypothetical protein [Planctomycetaceae bacterium]
MKLLTRCGGGARGSRLYLCLLALIALLGGVRAEDAVAKARWNITAEFQMVTLPQKAALPLIAELSDDAKIEAAWVSIQQMIARGEVALVAVVVLKGVAGKKLMSESIQEVRYPTEFEPPQLPQDVPKEKAAEVLKNWPVVGITPTAFETRNTGAMLELEATVSDDGAWISAQVVPQHVRLLRFAKYDAGVLPSGERLSVEQPQFSVLKNTLSVHAHRTASARRGPSSAGRREDDGAIHPAHQRAPNRHNAMTLRCAVLGMTSFAIANAPVQAEPSPTSVRVEVQMVSISTADALRLVPAFRDEKTVAEANARLQQMLAREEATLLGWPVTWTGNRGRSVSETVEEFKYPTEFDPPQGGGGRFVVPWPVGPTWGEEVPTAFETRNVGCTLEAETAVEADGRTIALVLHAQFVRFLDFRRYRKQASALGIEGVLVQPQFFRTSTKSALRVRNGQPTLLSVFVVPKPEPHVELFIVRATATLPGAPAPIPSKK